MSPRPDRAELRPEHVFGGRAEQVLGQLADGARRHVVDLHDRQRLGVEQGDRERRRLDHPTQRRLRLEHRGFGLAAPLDVEQRVGELARPARAGRGNGIADHPEGAAVAAADPAFEGPHLAADRLARFVLAQERMVGLLGGGDHRHRPAREIGQAAGEHALRRAIHPLDAVGAHRDDADQHRIEDRPGPAGQVLALAGERLERQVALFLDAAIRDDAHEAPFATGRAVATDDGAQATHLAVGPGHPALRLDRRRAGLQSLQRTALAPGEQTGQARRALVEGDRDAARHLVERRVAADQQAAVVEQDHADRAEIEPVVELAHRAVGTLPGGVLAGRVLQDGEELRTAIGARHDMACSAEPALLAVAVQQPPVGHVGRTGRVAGGGDARAALESRRPVLLELDGDENRCRSAPRAATRRRPRKPD